MRFFDDLDDRGLLQLLGRTSEPVLAVFVRTGCEPCERMMPHLRELTIARREPLQVATVDLDRSTGLADTLGICGYPALALLHGPHILRLREGALDGPQLRAWIDEGLAKQVA